MSGPVKHGGCAACGSKDEQFLVSGLNLAGKVTQSDGKPLGCYSAAACSRCAAFGVVEFVR